MIKSTLRSAATFAAALATGATGAALATTPAQATTTASTSTAQAVAVSDTLLPGQKLLAGQYIRSKSGVFGLAMTRYGTLGLTQRGVKGLLWQANFRPGVVAVMGTTGSLNIIFGRTQIASIGAKGSPNAKLVLPNTGNLAVYNANGEAVWNRHLIIETLTAGFEIRPADAFGGDVTMYSFNRAYSLVMRTDGDLVLLQNKTVLWRTSTAGHPHSTAWMLSDGTLETVNESGDAIYRFATRRDGAVLQLLSTGRLQLVHGRTVVKILH